MKYYCVWWTGHNVGPEAQLHGIHVNRGDAERNLKFCQDNCINGEEAYMTEETTDEMGCIVV